MLELMRYAVRLAAAAVLAFPGIVFLSIGALSRPVSWAGVVIGTVLTLAGLFTWPRRPNAWRSDPATEKQLAYARDLGLPIPAKPTKGQLSDLISSATGK